jgi:hypothetical protein
MRAQPKITLPEWAAKNWSPPPTARTLATWASNGYIKPMPEKIGRTYYVQPDAKYIDQKALQLDKIRADAIAFIAGEAVKHTQRPVVLLSIEQLRELPTAGFYDTGVYFLWLGSTLQYVGQSQQVQRRTHAHAKANKIPHDRYTFLSVERGLLDIERAYISAYAPSFNQVGRKPAA